jgi:tetratricopeptide (TPR) repeat protein
VLLSRLLTPTEGASLGETLWIVQLSFFTLLIAIWDAYRAGGAGWRFGRVDGAIGLLALGPLLSAALNFDQADRRPLVNMVWEWCGLVATWLLIRRVADRPAERRSLVTIVLCAALTLAGLGLWQHYSGFDATRREVARLQTAWDELEQEGRPSDPAGALAWDRKQQRLRAEFVRQQIPMDGPARQQWNQRLFASTEPLGLFALTNTLAGILVVALLLWLGSLAELFRRGASRAQTIPAMAAGTILAYCLLLTKGRTAYVGLAVGLAAAALGLRGRRLLPDRFWRWGAAAALVMVVLAAAALLSGAVDRQVVTQSLKSLRYRGEYWTGAWRMMTDGPLRWLTGIGPGNFRPFYLQYKLPESSEEIADPHNLFLDVWAGGGLVALAGLLLLLGAGLRRLGRPVAASAAAAEPEPEAPRVATGDQTAPLWRDPIVIGGAAAFIAVYLLGGNFDEQMFPLLCGFLVALGLAFPLRRFDLSAPVYGAAFAGLTVHLLGAGGIAMPAITQTLFLLAGLGAAIDAPVSGRRRTLSRLPIALCGAGCLALYLGCWFTATAPMMNARADLLLGEQALYEDGNPEKARRAFQRAAAADPLDAEACRRLAELYFLRSRGEPVNPQELFDASLYWGRQVIIRQPHDYRGYQLLGSLYLERLKETGDPADGVLAADELTMAVALYPQQAELQSELAEAFWRGGRPDAARSFAERAIELDGINRTLGHLDKCLADPRRALLVEILTAK